MLEEKERAGQADRRIRRAVRRLLIELFWLGADQAALRELTGREHFGYDFFLVSQRAFNGDRLLRLIRILDEDREAASFWYLHRCLPKTVERHLACATEGIIDIANVQAFSLRLKKIRDRSFIHIDKYAVFDPEAIYVEAGITGAEIVQVVDAIWGTLRALYQELAGEALRMPGPYTGTDIGPLHARYLEYRREAGA